jgi:hypothetical protein
MVFGIGLQTYRDCKGAGREKGRVEQGLRRTDAVSMSVEREESVGCKAIGLLLNLLHLVKHRALHER